MKEYLVDNEKRIAVYDDLFPLVYRNFVYQFATNSLFTIGWEDSLEQNKQNYKNLHSIYAESDMINLKFVSELEKTIAGKELENYQISNCILNLSSASDINFIHTHAEDKILLYYVNLDWREEWYGETLFYSEDKKNVMHCSPYTPGRLIVFDASIPHTIRPQSNLCQCYRFTLAFVLTIKNNDEQYNIKEVINASN